jgi:hypothetical protein
MFKIVAGMSTGLDMELVPIANGTRVPAKAGIFGRQVVAEANTLPGYWSLLLTQIWGKAKSAGLDEEALSVAEERLRRHSRHPAS